MLGRPALLEVRSDDQLHAVLPCINAQPANTLAWSARATVVTTGARSATDKSLTAFCDTIGGAYCPIERDKLPDRRHSYQQVDEP